MKPRALVVANDLVGSTMTGPGLRAYKLAAALADDFDVTLVVPFGTDLVDGRLDVVVENPWDASRMSERVHGLDLVVAQRLPVPTMRSLAASDTFVVYDLYAPLTVEQLALDVREEPSPLRESMAKLNDLTQAVALATGDAFVCASERQRDFWLGALSNSGRLDTTAYRLDPALRSLIDVVPFGIDAEPPVAGPAIRGVVPGIGESDRVLLWPGGIWNWFDPLTVIRAVSELSQRHHNVRLYFLGIRHPTPGVSGMPHRSMADEAVALAEDLGVRDRHVFFNIGWVPYEDRGRYFLDADLAVSAHFDDLETRLAFRTRILDCLWGGLPIVTTRGDTLGDQVVEAGAGVAVEPLDVDGWVGALDSFLSDDQHLLDARRAAARLSPSFEWPKVVEPLRRLVDPAGRRISPHRSSFAASADYVRLRLRIAVAQHGVAGAARTGFGRALCSAKRPLRHSVR
jgi:glycosyltransferase involved in cell wall biosynthesis